MEHETNYHITYFETNKQTCNPYWFVVCHNLTMFYRGFPKLLGVTHVILSSPCCDSISGPLRRQTLDQCRVPRPAHAQGLGLVTWPRCAYLGEPPAARNRVTMLPSPCTDGHAKHEPKQLQFFYIRSQCENSLLMMSMAHEAPRKSTSDLGFSSLYNTNNTVADFLG